MIKNGRKPLIIDCGANMGASATWFDLRFPGSAIVAVEPADANFLLLKENCKDRENVQVVEAGIGGEDGNAFVQDCGGGHWGYQTGKAQTGKPVRIVSLSSIIKANADSTMLPFLLKIDVEGAEKELFGHSLETIAAFPVIVIETHDFYMPSAGTASPFFRFHADTGRDFLFRHENVFSIDMNALGASAVGRWLAPTDPRAAQHKPCGRPAASTSRAASPTVSDCQSVAGRDWLAPLNVLQWTF